MAVISLAWLVERTNMPGKIWIYAGVPMTLAVPGMLQAMAWVILLSPRIGFINKTLQNAFNLSAGRPSISILLAAWCFSKDCDCADRFSDAGAAHARHGPVAGRSRGGFGARGRFRRMRKVTLAPARARDWSP